MTKAIIIFLKKHLIGGLLMSPLFHYSTNNSRKHDGMQAAIVLELRALDPEPQETGREWDLLLLRQGISI